jgi:hypothetical protein
MNAPPRPVPYSRQIRRILVRFLLIVLVLLEFGLLTGFLPQRWQESILARVDKLWPSQSHDYSRITHPSLDAELQPFEPLGMAVLVVLVVVNGSVIVALWRRRDP